MPKTVASSAASQSQSAKMICGFLPPSSIDTFLSVCADLATACLPTLVDPVKDNMSTSGCVTSTSPTTLPVPTTMLTTPAGTPAATRISPSITVVPDVTSAGLTTAVQPAASANGSFWLTIRNGKFHGVMMLTTPIGSRSTTPSVASPNVL